MRGEFYVYKWIVKSICVLTLNIPKSFIVIKLFPNFIPIFVFIQHDMIQDVIVFANSKILITLSLIHN